jgi:hypothetical protein
MDTGYSKNAKGGKSMQTSVAGVDYVGFNKKF